MWYAPNLNEIITPVISDNEIRRWIKLAAEYYGIPHVLLAVILQQQIRLCGILFLILCQGVLQDLPICQEKHY